MPDTKIPAMPHPANLSDHSIAGVDPSFGDKPQVFTSAKLSDLADYIKNFPNFDDALGCLSEAIQRCDTVTYWEGKPEMPESIKEDYRKAGVSYRAALDLLVESSGGKYVD